MDNAEAGNPINLSFAVRNDQSSNIQVAASSGGTAWGLTKVPDQAYVNPGDMQIFRVTGEAKPGEDISVVLTVVPFYSSDIQALDGKSFQITVQVK